MITGGGSDVAGKIFARIIQNRLQVIVEGLLPDSQCGFQRGCGCGYDFCGKAVDGKD